MERGEYSVNISCIDANYGYGEYGRETLYMATIYETMESFYFLTSVNLYSLFDCKRTPTITVPFEKMHRVLINMRGAYFGKSKRYLRSEKPEIINGYPYMLNQLDSVYEIDGNYIFVDAKYRYIYALRDTTFSLFGDFLFKDGECYHIDDTFKTEKVSSMFNLELRVKLRACILTSGAERITPYEIYSNQFNLRIEDDTSKH
ncbi:hypothetical protein HNP86_001781 [Methanococcus maripaludis]|uniref:Uncharacterized protein n=1 Tax=Methanococcus maripaludis TaxID=39152 RepID=A0A7J9NVB4_METMI|nr:hypothetical protein [Methanococcus maripaludis]MBA2851622.1 hypothetical protein [Methanococcus maripaludis]